MDSAARKARKMEPPDLMRGEKKERWMELCEQAANETDSAETVEALITGDNLRLLDESRRIKHQTNPKPVAHSWKAGEHGH